MKHAARAASATSSWPRRFLSCAGEEGGLTTTSGGKAVCWSSNQGEAPTSSASRITNQGEAPTSSASRITNPLANTLAPMPVSQALYAAIYGAPYEVGASPWLDDQHTALPPDVVVSPPSSPAKLKKRRGQLEVAEATRAAMLHPACLPTSFDKPGGVRIEVRGKISTSTELVILALDAAQRAAEAELAVNEAGLAW
jgi:hypothetical protein